MKKNFALVALLAVLAVSASAQVNTRRGDWDRGRDWDRSRDWDRDRDRDRDWNWDRDRDPRGASIESLTRRAERESNSFRAWFERNYNGRRLGRDRDNRWLKNEIQSLDEAMERVRRRADDRRPNNGRRDFEDAMDHARRIDRELVFNSDRDNRFTVREWVEFRLTLDRLARVYGVRRI